MNNLERLKKSLSDRGIPGFLVTNIKNIRYLTGFSGSSAYLLIRGDEAVFFTDFRYDIQSREEIGDLCRIRITSEGIFRELPEYLSGLSELYFEPESMTYEQYEAFKDKLGIPFLPLKGAVYALRKIKGPDEVKAISSAQAITERVFSWVLDNIRPGQITEAELALEMDYLMRKEGADGPAFPTIVAGGPHSALPHARPRDAVIEKNAVLLLDFGASLMGYASDMTRTIWIGPSSPPEDFTEIYGIVKEAQERAIVGLRPGLSCRDADAMARDFIAEKGFGERFGHGLGHGVGLDVHEAPHLSYLADCTLEGGEVTTVEPGIYIEGVFGVRIEDMVWVKEPEAEVITRSPKDLIVV
ncbi:MAG: Xaa-Pro peptidase family protein [candidate division WOR-3 bacterium]